MPLLRVPAYSGTAGVDYTCAIKGEVTSKEMSVEVRCK
jgi:hypothetical protein